MFTAKRKKKNLNIENIGRITPRMNQQSSLNIQVSFLLSSCCGTRVFCGGGWIQVSYGEGWNPQNGHKRVLFIGEGRATNFFNLESEINGKQASKVQELNRKGKEIRQRMQGRFQESVLGQKIGKKGEKGAAQVKGERECILRHKIGRRTSPLCGKEWNKTGMWFKFRKQERKDSMCSKDQGRVRHGFGTEIG